MIECPKCGHENTLGRLFCDSCGQRLDVSGVHPVIDDQPAGRRRKKRKKGGARGGKRRLRALLVVALVAAVVAAPLLAAWRPEMPAGRTSFEQAARYRSTRDRVQMLMVGQGAKIAVFQDDANSYIAYLRQRRPTLPRTLVSFEEDGVRAFVSRDLLGVELVTVFHWKTGGGDGPAFRPASLFVGHLPLPTVVFPWAARQFPEVLEAFDTELHILNNCVSARVPSAGRLHLEVRFRS